jgi:hypothetical protein
MLPELLRKSGNRRDVFPPCTSHVPAQKPEGLLFERALPVGKATCVQAVSLKCTPTPIRCVVPTLSNRQFLETLLKEMRCVSKRPFTLGVAGLRNQVRRLLGTVANS